jgi:hypothetical protein
VADEAAPPDAPEPPPVAPFTPEDGLYQAIVSEYLGLQRAGAGTLDAALITAAHLVYLAVANAQQGAQEP